jgi:AraC-like DNA-binding protein
MTLSLYDLFILFSVLLGVLLGLTIRFAPALRSPTNNYLAYFMLLLSGITLLGWQEWDLFWPDWLWSLMWEYLIPVILLQYFLRVLQHPLLKAPWINWLYAPFLVTLFFDLFCDVDFSFGLYELPFSEDHRGYLFIQSFIDSLSLWWNIALIGWCFVLAYGARKVFKVHRNWLLRFSLAMIGVLTIWFISAHIALRTDWENPYFVLRLTTAAMVLYIAYAGVYQLRIQEKRAKIRELLDKKAAATVDGLASNMVVSAYDDQIRKLMEEEELYRDPDLGRQMLAERLGVSEGYVSQIIRETTGEGLVEYISGQRIAAAKRMLSSPEFRLYALEAIGREAGFKSRSTFYETFKKITGKTPGMYRKATKAS